MDAKEYLQSIRDIDRQLRVREREWQSLRRDIYSLQSLDYSKDVVSGGRPTWLDDKIARLVDALEEIKAEWDVLIDRRQKARALIRKLPDVTEQTVLIERYILARSWEQIAFDLGVTWRHAWRVHERAFKKFSEIF